MQEVAKRLGLPAQPTGHEGYAGARTMLLGVIVREITDPFFSVAIEALSTEALARGYNVVLGSAHSKADEAIALRAVLETRHCDAILLLGDMRDEPKFLEDLRAYRTDSGDRSVAWHRARRSAHRQHRPTAPAWSTAIDHLIDLGHERIAFIGGRPLGDIRERRTAFLRSTSRTRASRCPMSM